ncbi:MAG: phage tail protein [Methylotenera sp.]|nr:phage tail protein [Methylotenera sp.]
MTILDRNLPEPSFIDRDPDAVVLELITQFQSLTGRALYPAQVERILVDVIAYRESLLREGIQDAAKLNLVRFSRAPMLDYIGENIGVTRLLPRAANTLLRFNLNAAITPLVLPIGTAVASGNVVFLTTENTTIPANISTIDVPAACSVVGIIGNGFAIGQINNLVNVVAGIDIVSVNNITQSADGIEYEDDEQLRERIVLAPESFTNAGSIGAYKFHARSANQNIIDVAIHSPIGGQVDIYPLTKTGLPSTIIKDQVLEKCAAETVRPLCDTVFVKDPINQTFTIDAQLTIYDTADAAIALNAANIAINNFVATSNVTLGKDIVRTQIIDVLHGYGVYKVDLISPAADIQLDVMAWANCTNINITIAGVANG